MQGAPGQLDLREAAKRGEIVAPNLYLAGPQFSGNAVKSAEDAAARVRQQKSEGWDLLKVQEGLAPPPTTRWRRPRRKSASASAATCPTRSASCTRSTWARKPSITSTATSSSSTAAPKPVDDKALQDLVQRTRKAGAWIVPTMVVWETLQGPVTLESRTGFRELRYLPATQVEQWTKALGLAPEEPAVQRRAGEAAHRQPRCAS